MVDEANYPESPHGPGLGSNRNLSDIIQAMLDKGDKEQTKEVANAILSVPTDELVGLHNELSAELQEDRKKLAQIMNQSPDDLYNNPDFNYKLGKVIGFEVALRGLEAFVKFRGAEQSGEFKELLEPGPTESS